MKTLICFIRLSLPFWANRKQWLAWLLLMLVIGFALSIIQVSVWITEWNKSFYDAVAEFNGAVIPHLVMLFIGYISLIVSFIVCGNWLRKALIFRWREHLTQQFQQNWLQQHRHYFLANHPYIDNPDQRIAQDIALLTEQSIDLFKYFIMNCAKLVAFISILWQISGGGQQLKLGQWTINITGYLVWIALIYSIICTLLMHKIGYKLQGLNVQRQQKEADYRHSLLQIREHSEQIAAYQGEKQENQRLKQNFQQIKQNWFALINREFKVEIFSATYLRISLFIPIFATLPMYLARSITFGDMMQARSAFSNVQDGFGWFMDYYKRLIEWAATIERLSTLQQALMTLNNNTLQRQQLHSSETRLQVKQLHIHTPQGEKLLTNIHFSLQAKQWLCLEGKSGIGKSTLLKTLVGLWEYAQGEVQYCPNYLFLPQKPYIMMGKLREVLSYPLTTEFTEQTLIQCLTQVGLTHLSSQLDHQQDWQNRLSGGEQQRLSLARALLLRPKLLLLDESTSQLDDQSALSLIQLLQQQLPDTACLLVSHQEVIKQLCSDKLVIVKSE